MAIKPLDEMPNRKHTIDLTGPDGNAFALIAQAHGYCRVLSIPQARADEIIKQMQAGDYENLLAIFDENFGDYCTLYR